MLGRTWFSGSAAVLVLMLAQVVADGQSANEKHKPDLDKVRKQIFEGTNTFRKSEKRGKLKVNADLSKAAQSFAEFMADHDKYGHTADGKEPWDRVAQAGYQYCIVLENIAYEYNSEGFTTGGLSETLVKAWENSPPHRKNMLDPDVSEIGVGVVRSSKTGRFYAVQDYGRPKSAVVTFKIANKTKGDIKYTIDGKEFTLARGFTETHEDCRPPELKFEWPDGAEATKAAKETWHPTAGAEYIVRKNGAGDFTVEQP